MFLPLIIFNFCVILVYSSSLKYNPNGNCKIIGGSDAPDGTYTYQISLQENGKHRCGGTIVHPEWVITAAHCLLPRRQSFEQFKVVAGSIKLSEEGDVYEVLDMHSHPNYTKSNNDVAILKIPPIKFNAHVSKIKVETENVGGNVPVILTGWGVNGSRLEVDNLQHIDLKTTTLEFCKEEFPDEVEDTHICTFTKKCEGACYGDSGGPLVEHKGNEFVLTGIVSWGIPCANGYADVYSRVSSYIEWFNSKCNDCLNK